MTGSSRRIRRALVVGAAAATAAAMIFAGVTASAVGAQAKPHAGPAQIGPGYPPPGGIYTPFTNCPLLNPIMLESVENTAACVAGQATSGSITIGNITTPVVRPVNVQFGFWDPPNASAGGDNPAGGQWAGGILPPPAGLSAMLVTKPDLIPESLTTVLGCSTTTNTVVENLCEQATYYGGKYNDVYALAQSAGQLTNFELLSWTQRIMFRLINPLLGSHCYIGSANNPVVVNPVLTGTATITYDPNPVKHPNTGVITVAGATASDTTFTAPGVTGCGPGGVNNIPVDEAIDTGAGLPAASGVNSLTLYGNFYVAASTPPAPFIGAKTLLSAFKDSVGTPPPSGSREAARRIPAADLHQALHRLGLLK
jgi:hypothetical protein